MAKTKTFPVGMTDEQRARFQKEADKTGVSLAQWLRDAGEMRAAGGLPTSGGVAVTEEVVQRASREAERGFDKVFRGPDPKVKPRATPREDKRRG